MKLQKPLQLEVILGMIWEGRHGRQQKFSRGRQSHHFAYLFQVVGDATQMGVYKKENVQRYGNSCIQCFLCKKTLHWV